MHYAFSGNIQVVINKYLLSISEFSMLRVIFLGTGGSLPTRNRNPSAVMVNREGELLLFDCGEGTQQQMMRAKTGMMSLSSIFVSHFHADHFLGNSGSDPDHVFHGKKRTSYNLRPGREQGNLLSFLRLLAISTLNMKLGASS